MQASTKASTARTACLRGLAAPARHELPGLAAAISRKTYTLIPVDDWAALLAIMMRLDKPDATDATALDMMRVYHTIHAGARPPHPRVTPDRYTGQV